MTVFLLAIYCPVVDGPTKRGAAIADQIDIWFPRNILSIGVTGHRLDRLGRDRVGEMGRAVDALFDAVERATPGTGDGLQRPIFRLVTSLAEGADSIAADCAFARGWTVDVVLPFAREDYSRDFTDPVERTAHTAQLASANAVFELPGERGPERSEEAYERAGRVVLDQCDLLLAIWDGAPAWGRGGAAQIVAEAVQQDIPVLQIVPESAAAPILLWDGIDDNGVGQQNLETVAKGGLEHLPKLLHALLAPPSDDVERWLKRDFSQPRRRWGNIGLAYPLLLAMLGVRRLRLAQFADGDPTVAMASVVNFCGAFADPDDGFGKRLRGILASRFAHADLSGTKTAQLYRSGFVTNYALAAFATVISLLGFVLSKSFHAAFVILELSAIASILVLTSTGNRQAWHRRWLDARELAERLRCLAISVQFGDLRLRSARATGGRWVNWYVRATAREVGLPSLHAGTDYLRCLSQDLKMLIDDQVAYLSREAERMHKVEHRLSRLGEIFFIASAFVCLTSLASLFTAKPLLGESDLISTAFNIASAALPAIGAAAYGIRVQGDFAGTAKRNEALAHRLKIVRALLDREEPRFDRLRHHALRVTMLLTEDLEAWRQIYHARPLTLPG